MKSIAVFFLALGLVVLPGCVRTKTEVEIAADNTATIKQNATIKTEAIDAIKNMMESMGGEDDGQLDKLTDQANEKKMVQELKDTGVEVTKSKAIDEGGWKGAELEGKIKDVNDWVKKSAQKVKEKADSADEGGSGISGMAPRFFKTSKEGVARLQIMEAPKGGMGGMDPEMLEAMGDEEMEMVQAQMDMMGSMFSLSEMNMEIVVTLPGDVVEAKSCKKLTDRKVSFQMKGTDINVAGMKNMFGMKEGVSVDFKIPEGFKITLEEPAAPKAEKAKEEEDSEKSKGGLKIR
ncbi:MAG TPA: hypothetical protein PKA37_05230 [Planctomycetota bacterium]|nr:hypothetical protein [Planctomycetota bacterium]